MGHSPDRSPYLCNIEDFTKKYCLSDERADILDGFLNYRNELYQENILVGFQWLNGSFCEEIEVNEGRSPNDIDVVTFMERPPGVSLPDLMTARPDIFKKSEAKTAYRVDAHFMELGTTFEAWNVKLLSYWYSLWAHRRDAVWKGFVQVPLSPADDNRAKLVVADFRARRSAS
jgi:hypothetical protein